jgi:hypothetical protein
MFRERNNRICAEGVTVHPTESDYHFIGLFRMAGDPNPPRRAA